ncbi:hypothetical protein QZH41_007678 [Actinostola sp. cb2023]|nr:hypothetical protein QZH41_007678 [Actinostola sp. cb2023]
MNTRKRRREEIIANYQKEKESLLKLNAQLNMRKRQLACELTYIYPIVQLDSKDFFICGVRLPNSESDEFFATDDETLSCSLGYACHLVYMISKILEVPQRYAMNPMGSRSTIMDFTIEKVADKDKEFPLHTKGKEKIQFYYGIFLLNKNIAQLRQYCNLGTPNLRNTLPNIKDTLETKFRASSEPIKPSMIEQTSSKSKTPHDTALPPKMDTVPTTSSPIKPKPTLMPKPINIPSKPDAGASPNTSPSKPPLPPKPQSMRRGTAKETLSDRENELLTVVNYDFTSEQDSSSSQERLPVETPSTNAEHNGTMKVSASIKPPSQGATHKFFDKKRMKKGSKSFSSSDLLQEIPEAKHQKSWSNKRKSLHELRDVPVEVMREKAALNAKISPRRSVELDGAVAGM